MKVIYRSEIAKKVDNAIIQAVVREWPIEYIELNHDEWFSFKTYLAYKSKEGIMSKMIIMNEIQYQGVVIKKEG